MAAAGVRRWAIHWKPLLRFQYSRHPWRSSTLHPNCYCDGYTLLFRYIQNTPLAPQAACESSLLPSRRNFIDGCHTGIDMIRHVAVYQPASDIIRQHRGRGHATRQEFDDVRIMETEIQHLAVPMRRV